MLQQLEEEIDKTLSLYLVGIDSAVTDMRMR